MIKRETTEQSEVAYEGYLAMPSSSLVTQNGPLTMHRDASSVL